MTGSKTGRFIYFIRLFFPVQLLFGHIKYNFSGVVYWAVLFLIVSDQFASRYGVPFLFYSPEYLGEISSFSFALLGFALGGFTMAFNMSSYVRLSSKYPFMATLSRPFMKFCLNNSIIPFVFLVLLMYKFSSFQLHEEFASMATIFTYNLSFIGGYIVFVSMSLLYFFPTNKDVFKLTGSNRNMQEEEPIQSFLHNKLTWNEFFRYEKERSYIYMYSLFRWRKSRSISHYDKIVLQKVFSQNQINASLFEFVTIISFIIMGIFRDSDFLEFPAAMSIVMLLTVILMLFSIVRSWFKYWTNAFVIAALIFVSFMNHNSSYFQFRNYAYGLSYHEKDLKKYSIASIQEDYNKPQLAEESKAIYIERLNAWKARTGEKKPKLVIIISSGGGSRSALWTFSVLQKTDALLKNKFANHIQMITGASGGMVGASFYRELLLRDRKQNSSNRFKAKYLSQISNDLLNKLSVTSYTNDLFFRYKTLKIGSNVYRKDRGFAFEEQLNQNTGYVMNHPLSYYQPYEQNAMVPSLIFTPTIANDGRRLVIGTNSLAFITHNRRGQEKINASYENIDFQSFFANNSTDSLRFTSVMRMSASFPFVLPMVSMPTNPEMQIMDAGLRDNYGGKMMLEYLFALEDWIRDNTSGVVVVKIRDTKKVLDDETFKAIGLKEKFTMPFGNMYDNFPKTQDYDQDEMMKMILDRFAFPVEILSFNLRELVNDRISLSWHLTSQEKVKIEKAFYSPSNQESLKRLIQLVNEK